MAWLALLAEAPRKERPGMPALQLMPDAVERILLHPWPDNLRGLDRLVHRFAGHAGPIGLRALLEALPELRAEPSSPPAPADTSSGSAAPPRGEVAPPTREELLAAYLACGKSVRSTAKHFGRDRKQIYRRLDRFGIPRENDD
jgi:transcriptional regulator of acetoin/glycerol metabolism